MILGRVVRFTDSGASIGLALALAEELEKIGEARNYVAAQLVGRWAIGRTRLFLGDFVAARAILERCLASLIPHIAAGCRRQTPTP